MTDDSSVDVDRHVEVGVFEHAATTHVPALEIQQDQARRQIHATRPARRRAVRRRQRANRTTQQDIVLRRGPLFCARRRISGAWWWDFFAGRPVVVARHNAFAFQASADQRQPDAWTLSKRIPAADVAVVSGKYSRDRRRTLPVQGTQIIDQAAPEGLLLHQQHTTQRRNDKEGVEQEQLMPES
ncbi:hypothetical protein [Tahibacter sp.]|uniref:hypothetical protein n=1 Tax=Tahibacter sp. TaxID=2056211 RepID=UPI0028C3783E|nr:hypothetical protein [Tahibacter sp.]